MAELREARTEDIEAIVSIQSNAWLQIYPNPAKGITKTDIQEIDWQAKIPSYQHMIKSPDYSVRVAVETGGVRGFSVVAASENDTATVTLEALYVAPSYQGNGIGSELIRHVLEEAKIVFLQVANYNDTAIDFYQGFGFSRTGQVGAYSLSGGGAIPTLQMRYPAQKSEKAGRSKLVTRRELARKSGVRESTIKWYSEIGLLPYRQSESGRRRYYDTETSRTRLEEIANLQKRGYSIEDLKKHF